MVFGGITEVRAAFSSCCRLTLNKTRLLMRAAKGFMSKSPSRVGEGGSEGDSENIDYLPLVSSSSRPCWGCVEGSRGQEDPPGSCLVLSLMAVSLSIHAFSLNSLELVSQSFPACHHCRCPCSWPAVPSS